MENERKSISDQENGTFEDLRFGKSWHVQGMAMRTVEMH